MMLKLKKEMLIEDDKSEFGGISFVGETLGNFLDEAGLNINTNSTKEIMLALKECGCQLSK